MRQLSRLALSTEPRAEAGPSPYDNVSLEAHARCI